MRIGLLGGSFNPAHDGHRHISLLALKRLRLHQVWWMVTPQNPLKSSAEIAPFAQRMAAARRVANHPRIIVTDIEKQLGTIYTYDTLRRLRPRFPARHFVWLMGADNLRQIGEWWNWERIFNTIPIAVFARPSYSHMSLAAKPSYAYSFARIAEDQAGLIADMNAPAWVFLHIPPHAGSATRIRASGFLPKTGVKQSAAVTRRQAIGRAEKHCRA